MVTVIWDSWLKAGSEEEGLLLRLQVWSDMQRFDGYLSHQSPLLARPRDRWVTSTDGAPGEE